MCCANPFHFKYFCSRLGLNCLKSTNDPTDSRVDLQKFWFMNSNCGLNRKKPSLLTDFLWNLCVRQLILFIGGVVTQLKWMDDGMNEIGTKNVLRFYEDDSFRQQISGYNSLVAINCTVATTIGVQSETQTKTPCQYKLVDTESRGITKPFYWFFSLPIHQICAVFFLLLFGGTQ